MSWTVFNLFLHFYFMRFLHTTDLFFLSAVAKFQWLCCGVALFLGLHCWAAARRKANSHLQNTKRSIVTFPTCLLCHVHTSSHFTGICIRIFGVNAAVFIKKTDSNRHNQPLEGWSFLLQVFTSFLSSEEFGPRETGDRLVHAAGRVSAYLCVPAALLWPSHCPHGSSGCIWSRCCPGLRRPHSSQKERRRTSSPRTSAEGWHASEGRHEQRRVSKVSSLLPTKPHTQNDWFMEKIMCFFFFFSLCH